MICDYLEYGIKKVMSSICWAAWYYFDVISNKQRMMMSSKDKPMGLKVKCVTSHQVRQVAQVILADFNLFKKLKPWLRET